MGFRTPSGLVNGKITFNGDIALEGAKVFATRANSNVQGVSLLMDGAGDYVTIPDDGWYPNSAFTISSWIKPTAPSNDQPVWYKNGAFSLSMSGVQANQQFDIYQPSFDTTRNVFVENVYGDVTNDTVYSTDGNTLLAYFRNDSLFHLSPYGISGIASNDTVYQQVSPYNIKYIRNRDMIAGYDTLHHPEYDTYSYPAPADLFGVIANDTVWESDSVRAFYRNDTLFQAEYTPRLEEKGDAYAYMSNDTLYTIGTSDYSVLHHDEFMNNSGTIVAFLDDTYIRYAVYGTGSNPIEGEVYGVLNNDTAWTYSPITVYDLEQTDTLAVRLLDTLYAFSDPSLVAYFKSNDSLFFSELLNASGYVAGTPYSVLYKNTAFNLAQDSIYGIWRGDTLYTHTESFLGVLGMDDTVRLEGDQALVIDNSDRVFTLDYLETITEDSILVRTEYRDVYQLDFEGMFSGGTVTLNSGDLYGDEYVNVMVAYDGAAAVFYVNGKEVAEIAATGTLTGTNDFLLGRENANYYTGYLDEVLVWEKALDSAEAYQNHGRFLIGNEDDMVGYWRFDENVGSYAYDASRDDAIDDEVLKYNRRHAAITNGTWSTEVADPELLGFSGFTDSLGNYTIPAIRYRGAGENFKITPVFLTHEFDPSNRILFIGEGSSIQNDIDFIDISSFKVTGFVRVDPEAFGFSRDDSDAPTCYIEGAVLMLDGVPIVQNNELAQTDASGKFEIQVPIGEHFISVIKNGHTFSLGQWPVNTDVHDFQEPISGITFYDETKRYWVGKVVGGTVEGEKFPGFGNVVNNVGKADITITSLGNECFEKDFSTDPLTGEFHVALPPLKYRVEEIEVPAQGPTFNQELRALADEMIDMADIYMTDTGKVNYDTVYFVDNGDKSLQNIDTIKELRYHLHRDYIYQALPEILVLRGDSATHLGDDTLAYADDLGAYSFKIPLQNQPFEHPVFSGGSPYSMWISVNERYFNYDADPSNPVVYSSRIPDASIEISNEIAGAVERLTLQSGDTLYVFDAGMPQTQEGGDFPLTRTLEVSGPRGVKWLPNVGPTEWEQTFRGYVLGTRPQGDNDFITVYDPTDTATEGGVKMVDFILRDPPGSQSYAYWKEGTTVKTYTDNKFSVGYLGQTQWWAGSKFTLYNFLGGAKLTENEGSIIHTVFGSVAAGGRFVRGTTHTTRTTITTNKDAYKPGAPSDIFVGSARNVLVGFSDAVQLIPVDKCGEAGVYCIGETFTNANGTFQLAKYEEFIVSPEQNFATTFVYTQDHIEREMKTLAEKRDRLFATAFYTSKVSSTHPAYGMNNDDPELTAHGLVPVVGSTTVTDDGPSYTYHRASDPREVDIDLVRFYNNQISVWEQTLAKNEEEKIQAMIRADAGQSSRTNYSFGSGVKIEGSESTTDRTLNSVTWEFEIGYKYGTLLDNNSAGVKVKLEAYSGIRGKENGNYTYDSTSTTEIGYVLHDKDINDQISVDVIESHANNGPIFVTKGGRTSCPWEPEATVKYFQEELGTPLSAGTVARDQPTIDIFPRTLYNVPAGEKATFRVILGNNNYTDSVRFYSLLLDSRTNPDGAEIRIDEQRIVKSWPVPMYAGELQEKTLNLQITATEFEYEDLLIYFHSPCQFNLGTTFELSIFDTASISAYFIPECTDVLLRTPTDKWTLNYEFNDTLDVAIGGYNYNYYQFDNVKFQMKESSESDERWLTWNTFWHENSEDIPNEPNLDTIPDDQFNIDYFWDVAQLTDGAYDLRAITTCGPEDVVTTSPVYSGIIDRVNPHPFGRPQPRDGILGPGDEIQITFNEKIDAGKLTWDNFDIRGVLNGGNLRHGASVYFDGSVKDYLRIDGLRMKAQSFTLEFWAKRLSTGEEIILSQGRAGTPQMTVGFNQNDRFYLDLNGAIIVSDAQFTDNKWHHFAVSYDRDLDNARLYADGGVLKVRDDFIVTYQGEGPLYVARRGHAPEDPFEGQVHELRFWRKGML
ncbi:MAG TPA: hypothetical protein DCE41_20685, partial [Cytophagales bacterium]|nr:hypothetical protein [Cytophagales bacterium]